MKKSDLVEYRGKGGDTGNTVTVIHSIPLTELYSMCQSQRKNYVTEMKSNLTPGHKFYLNQ